MSPSKRARRRTLPVAPAGSDATTCTVTGRRVRTRARAKVRVECARFGLLHPRHRPPTLHAVEHHEGHGHLAKLGIVLAGDGDGDDRRVRADDLFDLAGKDLLAAPVDDVVAPGDQVEVAVRVAPSEVARAQPATGTEPVGVRAAGVGVDHRRPRISTWPTSAGPHSVGVGLGGVLARRPGARARPARRPSRRGAAPTSGWAVIWLPASVMP